MSSPTFYVFWKIFNFGLQYPLEKVVVFSQKNRIKIVNYFFFLLFSYNYSVSIIFSDWAGVSWNLNTINTLSQLMCKFNPVIRSC